MRLVMHLIVATLISLTTWQCSLEKNHVVMEDVNTSGWDNAISLQYISDVTELRNISITLRVRESFEADKLAFDITTMTSDSLRYNEQVILPVDFQWQGSVARSMEIELPYRHNVELSRNGEYIIRLRPLTPIKGVESAGINFKSMK